MLGPVVPSHGPSNARILLLAEAPGEAESEKLRPLIGPSGYALRTMLSTIGVNLDDCFKTNCFQRRPPNNSLSAGYGTDVPSARSRALGALGKNPSFWLADDHWPELERLRAEIEAVSPNIIVALGNTACWALGLSGGITDIRGYIYQTQAVGDLALSRPFKVLPTYHPALILRQWSHRTICISDLEKARVEAADPTFTPDSAELWLSPSLEDMETFRARHLAGATHVATDVETKKGQITCVSFAPTPTISLCVPFWVDGPNPHYWPTESAEVAAWKWCAEVLEDPSTVKVMQNGLYDCQYMLKHGIKPQNCTADTMLLHHSMYSELNKGLGFLGSIYSNTPAWKKMRTFKREEALKKDD